MKTMNKDTLHHYEIALDTASFIHDQALFAIEIRMGYFDIAAEEGKIYPDEVDIDRIVGRIENASKRLEHMLNELKREIFEEEKGEERDGTENCDQR